MKPQYNEELQLLSSKSRELIRARDYDTCRREICDAMAQYPDAPHPHNLMGILLEMQGNHSAAMKHFRAATALDPSYLPASHNLQYYGTFFSQGCVAYEEADLCRPRGRAYTIGLDDRNLSYVVRRD